MAGIDNPNYRNYYRDTTNRRTGETPGADWTGGCNDAASCAPGIGINTGDYSPKVQDWSEDVRSPQNSAQIGQTASAVEVVSPDFADVNDQPAFVQADAQTAPDAQLDVATGAVNRTGKTVPANAWVWGVVPVA